MEKILYKRNYSLDIIRIIAVLAVILLHSSGGFVADYPLNTNEFVFGNLFDSLSRIGVPLFLMISGALFLDENKKIDLKTILCKNVKNLAIITIIWAIIYSVVNNIIFPLWDREIINVKSFISGIILGYFHMWYLYMIIGLYIITPFLRKFVSKENKTMVLLFISISFCFQFLTPIINVICNLGLNVSLVNTWIENFHLDFFGGYITYFMVGWYIVHIGIKQKWVRCSIYLLGAISLVSIILYVHFTGDSGNAYANIGAPVFLYSISVFLVLNNINFNFSEKTAKNIVALSKLTFGVYIIHMIFMCLSVKVFPYDGCSAMYIVVRFVIVAFASFFSSYIISKIPLLKKIIKA